MLWVGFNWRKMFQVSRSVFSTRVVISIQLSSNFFILCHFNCLYDQLIVDYFWSSCCLVYSRSLAFVFSYCAVYILHLPQWLVKTIDNYFAGFFSDGWIEFSVQEYSFVSKENLQRCNGQWWHILYFWNCFLYWTAFAERIAWIEIFRRDLDANSR